MRKLTLPQSRDSKRGANVKLLKQVERRNKIFPVGWCMAVDWSTKKKWIKDGTAEAWTEKELTTKAPTNLVDAKGDKIPAEQKQSK